MITPLLILFFSKKKISPERARRGESKYALRVIGGAWGAELRRVPSRIITIQSSCSFTVLIPIKKFPPQFYPVKVTVLCTRDYIWSSIANRKSWPRSHTGMVRKGSNTNPFTQKCVVKLSVPVCNKELGVEKGTARTTPVKSVAVVASVGEFFCVN